MNSTRRCVNAYDWPITYKANQILAADLDMDMLRALSRAYSRRHPYRNFRPCSKISPWWWMKVYLLNASLNSSAGAVEKLSGKCACLMCTAG